MAHLLEPNAELIEGIVGKLKTNGMFDEMRRDCLADIDTKPAFQNLKQRVENYVNDLLSSETWTPSLNKNQLRSKVRSSVMQSGMVSTGIDHILHQVVDAKMYTDFLPKISEFISDNSEALRKEFTPEPEVEEVEEVKAPTPEETKEKDEIELHSPSSPPPNDVADPMEPSNTQVEEMLDEEQKNTVVPSSTELLNVKEEQVPVIPEGAANTLRALIQSLATKKSLVKVENDEEVKDEVKEELSHLGNSPSIDPSQIEAFTDNEDISDNDAASLSGKVGPRTPEEPVASDDMSPGSPQSHISVNSTSEVVDSDISVHSEPETNVHQSDDNVVDNDSVDNENMSEEEMKDYSESEERLAEDSSNIEEDEIKTDDVQERVEEAVEEVEVSGYEQSETLIDGECVVVDANAEDLQEIAVEAEVEEGEDAEEEEIVEISHIHHSRYERKRHRKRHKRRRRSTSGDSSDGSTRVSVASSEHMSSEEAISEDTEVIRSRSRKKKKKKRSKKHKRSKFKMKEDSSPERPPWDSPSEYRRSSQSPVHPGQGRSFIPSPQPRPPMRFEENNRAVKVEPVFMSQMPHFRDPYAIEPRDMDGPRPPMVDIDRPFPMMLHEEPRMGFPPRPGFPPRSPPHFLHNRFSPPRFSNHPRFSPPYNSRPPFHMRPNSPPPRRYSPTFDFYRPRMHMGFDPPGPPRSPPYSRRFSPPRQMGRFPGPGGPPHRFPGPLEDRFMPHPGVPMPHGLPGPMMRPDMPPGGSPMDMRRPPMR